MSVDDMHAAFAAPETLLPAAGGDMDPPPPDPEADLPEAAGAQFPLNDYGNGQRLVCYFGDDILFVPRLGWYRWSGTRWEADEDELAVRRDAQAIAGKILAEVEFLAMEPWETAALDLGRDTADQRRELEARGKGGELNDSERERLRELREIADRAAEVREAFGKRKSAHRSHAKNSGNSGKITNMLLEARTAVGVSVNALNSDPLMLNCANGTLRFALELDPHDEAWGQTDPDWIVRLQDHDRGDMISKMVPVDFDPDAACPHWIRFLERIQPDPLVRDFLQRWFGYCLTGRTNEQKLAFFFGGGRNGKSTAVDVIAKILADYGTTIPIETLTGTEQRKGSDATPDLVRLPGARFVRASEPEQGQRMKEALVKALTGGEAIMIRRMMQEFVEVEPEFKLTISGNHKPEIRGGDDGIWRRVLLVPFTEQIPEAEVDRALPDKLWAERAGILAWMVRGTLWWLREGLQEPASVLEATEEYRQQSDPLRLFLTTECTIDGSDEFTKARDLADAFNAWLLERGESVWGRRTVANQIKARAGTVKGPEGHVFAPVKRSDTGYSGIFIHHDAFNRIAEYSDELRAGAARRG